MSQIFASGNDDYMFPLTRAGMQETGMIFESADLEKAPADTEPVKNVIDDASLASIRSSAMSAVLNWIEEGDFTYNSMDETVVVVADIDGDYDLTEEEEAYYTDIWNQIPDALLTLGAEFDDVQDFVNGPGEDADKAAARMGKLLSREMEEMEAEDSAIISGFAFGEDAILESSAYDEILHGILEASYKRKKVVRDGKVQIVRKRVSGKVRISAAQKAALKKARRKAHSATANLARKKSMKIRENRGL